MNKIINKQKKNKQYKISPTKKDGTRDKRINNPKAGRPSTSKVVKDLKGDIVNIKQSLKVISTKDALVMKNKKQALYSLVIKQLKELGCAIDVVMLDTIKRMSDLISMIDVLNNDIDTYYQDSGSYMITNDKGQVKEHPLLATIIKYKTTLLSYEKQVQGWFNAKYSGSKGKVDIFDINSNLGKLKRE